MGSTIYSFHVVDYVVFVAMLLISCGIGIYFACTGGKQKTTDEFLMGNRSMNTVAVALSMVASNMSAILVLGWPGEIYAFGGAYVLSILGSMIGATLVCVTFVPLLYPLQLTSSNEVRMCSVLFSYLLSNSMVDN